MTAPIQILSIKILHSKYRILFSILIYMLIYFCFYGDKIAALCMNENMSLGDMPLVAETKPTRNIRSIINREVSAFVGYSETLEEQKRLIQEQHKIISEYKKEIAFNQDMLHLIAGDDHIADAISERDLAPYINEVCNKHGKPLWYPDLENSSQYKK